LPCEAWRTQKDSRTEYEQSLAVLREGKEREGRSTSWGGERLTTQRTIRRKFYSFGGRCFFSLLWVWSKSRKRGGPKGIIGVSTSLNRDFCLFPRVLNHLLSANDMSLSHKQARICHVYLKLYVCQPLARLSVRLFGMQNARLSTRDKLQAPHPSHTNASFHNPVLFFLVPSITKPEVVFVLVLITINLVVSAAKASQAPLLPEKLFFFNLRDCPTLAAVRASQTMSLDQRRRCSSRNSWRRRSDPRGVPPPCSPISSSLITSGLRKRANPEFSATRGRFAE
jgi:hypothetical protein